jgi:hypothetical protein
MARVNRLRNAPGTSIIGDLFAMASAIGTNSPTLMRYVPADSFAAAAAALRASFLSFALSRCWGC